MNPYQLTSLSESQAAAIIQQHQPQLSTSYESKEFSFKLQNMKNGHRDKRNKTDILFIYKILWYMNTFRTVKTKCSLALKSGAGLKTTRILEDLISQDLIKVNYERIDRGEKRIENYEITKYGQDIFHSLEKILNVFKTEIIPEHKKEKIKLNYYHY